MGHFKRDINWKMRNWEKLKLNPDRYKFFKDSLKLFQNIKRSIYIDRKRKLPKENDIFVCDCIKSTVATDSQLNNPNISIDCGKYCINRLISTECEFNSCPCQELCKNRRFQQQQDILVYPFYTGAKGWGLSAGEFIPKGEFIMQYLGEVFSMNSEEGKNRCEKYSKMTCTYLMRIGQREVIDPTDKGNIARFINHSCDPNCETRKWNVLGEVEVGIFALKDIKETEELTFDYRFDVFKTAFTICLCKSYNCRGYLGIVPTDYTAEEWENKINNLICEICKGNVDNDGDLLLLCDGCNNGFHTFCLDPPINEMPHGPWFCDGCKVKNDNLKFEYPFKEENDENEINEEIFDKPAKLKKMNSEKKREKTKKIESLLYTDKEDFDFLNNYLSEDSDEEYQYDEDYKSKIWNNNNYSEPEIQAFNYFNQVIKNTEAFVKLYDSSFLNELNKVEDNIRDNFQVSSLEITVFKEKIFRLIILKIKAKIFWNHTQFQKNNIFLKNNEFTIIGNERQINYIKNIFTKIQDYCNILKDKYGINEATITIPSIFLKRVIGEYHKNIVKLEEEYDIKIFYDKYYLKDECYPIYWTTKLYLKGTKNNINLVYKIIKDKLKNIIVQRRYLNINYIKIIIQNLSEIKKEIYPTEVRCSRDNPIKDLNHPFYMIYYKNKEVSIIGTKEELIKAENVIFNFIYNKTEIDKNYFSISYLLPVYDKNNLYNVRNELTKEFPHSKIIIFDPLIQKKNICLNVVINYKMYDEFYKRLCILLNEHYLGNEDFEEYQNLINYKICKFFYKYLQNYMLTKSNIFLKTWDTITQEFSNNFKNFNSIYNQINNWILKDNKELWFYLFSTIKSIILDKLSEYNLTKLSVLNIIKYMLLKINIPNQNFFNTEVPRLINRYYNRKEYSISSSSSFKRSYNSKEKFYKNKNKIKNHSFSSSSTSSISSSKEPVRNRSYSRDSNKYKRKFNPNYNERYSKFNNNNRFSYNRYRGNNYRGNHYKSNYNRFNYKKY